MKIIAINASRIKSGGGLIHLEKILYNYNYENNRFSEIHIWGYKDVLNIIPQNELFIKHIAFSDNKNMAYQIFWEMFILPKELNKFRCELLINLDAGSFCRFLPNITMSRDMLSYENGILKKYFFSVSWLRLISLKYVQIWSLKNSSKPVFLTNYAKYVIEKDSKYVYDSVQIPHGIDRLNFDKITRQVSFSKNFHEIVYVSNFDLYKNQDIVIRGFKLLSRKHRNIRLHLVGAFSHNSYFEKCKKMASNDERIIFHGPVKNTEIYSYLCSADILLFASSCENMPNTLLEYMSANKPILCSNKGPMPEILGEWDYYFNPEDELSLVFTLDRLISDFKSWDKLSNTALKRVQKYSWKKSSDDLFNLANEILK